MLSAFRKNWVAIVFLVAVVGSYFGGRQDSINRDRAQSKQLITGCERSTERGVLLAAYQQTTSDVRRAAGTPKDIVAADRYQMFALGNIEQLQLPRGLIIKVHTDTNLSTGQALIQSVVPGVNEAGEDIYRLRPAAKVVVHQGCVEAYG